MKRSSSSRASSSGVSSTSSSSHYEKKDFEGDNFWSSFYWTNAVTATPSVASDGKNTCVCKYPWKDNIHGLCTCLLTTNVKLKLITFIILLVGLALSVVTTVSSIHTYMGMKTTTLLIIRQKRDLRFPNITICPKNSDAINLTLIKDDIQTYIPDLNDTDVFNLVTFAIAGSGFDNMDTITKKWDAIYLDKLVTWFQEWQSESERNLTEIYKFIHEKAGYKCSDLFILCSYGGGDGDTIPCCDIFRYSYVMLRGRCLKLREFYQEDPALTGTVTIYMRNLTSQLVERGGAQPQTILYVSDEYPDVATFPRYYMSPRKWNQLRLQRQVISMLPNNPYCSNSTEHIGKGTCFVNSWLYNRVVKPLNCTLFYLQHKHPNLPVCRPESIVRTYDNVIDLAFNNDTGCLPTCFRRDTAMSLQITQVTSALVQDLPDSVFQLEFAFDALQEEMFQEIVTTTAPGFISEFGGQMGLFLGISATSCIQVGLYLFIFFITLSKYLYNTILSQYHNKSI